MARRRANHGNDLVSFGRSERFVTENRLEGFVELTGAQNTTDRFRNEQILAGFQCPLELRGFRSPEVSDTYRRIQEYDEELSPGGQILGHQMVALPDHGSRDASSGEQDRTTIRDSLNQILRRF
jgi:hypothetical protein